LIQNHADLHKLYVQFSHQISLIYFKLLKNTNVLISSHNKPFTLAVYLKLHLLRLEMQLLHVSRREHM
jgi:hypothetical protein